LLERAVFALLLLWVTTYRNSWGQVFHTENLMVLHVVLAVSPAAMPVARRAAFGRRARRRRRTLRLADPAHVPADRDDVLHFGPDEAQERWLTG
jgi:hypothetical protein